MVEYLGRYTHKIAISNHRIQKVTNQEVSFSLKNYRKNGKKEQLTLNAKEFIRRFAQHILPKGFVRIRHYRFFKQCRETEIFTQFTSNFRKTHSKERNHQNTTSPLPYL